MHLEKDTPLKANDGVAVLTKRWKSEGKIADFHKMSKRRRRRKTGHVIIALV